MEIVPRQAVSDVVASGVPFRLIEGGNSYLNSLVGTKLAEGDARTSTIEIETVTLDDFWRLSGWKPTVIKIDVEGAELLAVRGAEALLSACHPKLIVAVHRAWMPQGQTAEELFVLLCKHGYRIVDSKVVRYEDSDFGD
jgi:hypothetical protein